MTYGEMMAEVLAARRESACALKMLAPAIGGFARGGLGGIGGNRGAARGPERPYSYQNFLGTHPPTFMPTAEPLDRGIGFVFWSISFSYSV